MNKITAYLGVATTVLLLSGVLLDMDANAKTARPTPVAHELRASAMLGEAEVLGVLGDELLRNCNLAEPDCRKSWDALERAAVTLNR